MITTDRIKSIIDSMVTKIIVEEDVVADGNGFATIPLKNTQYLYPKFILNLDGREAIVNSVKYNEEIVVKFDDNQGISAGEYVIDNPKYTWGTIIQFNEEVQQIRYTLDKYPIIYLFERYEDTEFHDVNNPLDVESDVRLFFLSNYDVNDYTKDDHYLLIKAMKNVKDLFMTTLKKHKTVNEDELTTSRNTNYVKFGTYTDNSGSRKNLVGDNLTGIEMKITIPFFKECCN